MANTKTLIYDDKAAGKKILPFPLQMPFARFSEELVNSVPAGESKTAIIKLASGDSIYEVAGSLAEHLSAAKQPHIEVTRIAALAASGDPEGLKLMYALLLAVPPIEILIEELAEFHHVMRMMNRIYEKEAANRKLLDSEEWFKKKVLLLSISHPLPSSGVPREELWLGWTEGVRLAFADPDRRWDTAVLERVKMELEALDLRIKMIVSKLDFERHPDTIVFLSALSEEAKWRIRAVEQTEQRTGETTLIMQRRLGERWNAIVDELRKTDIGAVIAELIDIQVSKAHPYTQYKTGTAVIKALTSHPAMRVKRADNLSCLHLFVSHAGRQSLDNMVPPSSHMKVLADLAGFTLDGRILSVDLRRINSANFVDEKDLPREIDWAEISTDAGLSYKSLALIYIDNDSFLVQLLDNSKATGKPGVIDVIAQRCRSPRILTIIANRRDLYTGFANKEVPVHLLRNPARVPLTALRKFVHVRYIDKMTLTRLSNRGSGIREEVRREIYHYLANFGK